MGHFETYGTWEKISEEEYLKEKEKLNKRLEGKGILEVALLRIHFNEQYQARPFYNGGIFDQINGTAELLYTEYYKRTGNKTYYLCNSKEYDYLKEHKLI